MFSNMSQEKEEDKGEFKPSRSNAGATPYHRRSSYLPQDPKQPRFRWLIYDNDGSFNGWFNWIPLHLRVGYWSPFVALSLVVVYTAIIAFKPSPLEFSPFVLDKLVEENTNNAILGMPRETAIDSFVFAWGIIVVIQAKISLGSISAFPISFTGWSWLLITSRAGLEFMAWAAATRNNNQLAAKLATIGSSIRFVAITNACVVCTIWNFILVPIIYFKSIPKGEKRRNFLKFNFGFFMTNIHLLNFPLAFLNILNGSRVRLFTISGKLTPTMDLLTHDIS